MFYDVDEISKLTGVSKVTIYKKLNKITELESHITFKNDKKYVDEEGLEIIKDNLQKTSVSNSLCESDKSFDIIVDQLKQKDNQINELHRIIENNQILLRQHNDKDIKQLEKDMHSKEIDVKLGIIREELNARSNLYKLNSKETFWSKLIKKISKS